MNQVISLVSLGMGSYNHFKQSLLDHMVDLRRLGENRIATRCMQKLLFLESRLGRVEILLREGPKDDMESCLAHVRRQEAWEQEARSREIEDLESIANFWVGQQHWLEEQIIDLNRTMARLRAELGQVEANLKGLQSDIVRVSKNAEAETRRLLDLRQADAAARSSREDRIRKAAEDKALEDHASKVAAAKEEISTFSVFD